MPLRPVTNPDQLVDKIVLDLESRLDTLITKYNDVGQKVEAADLAEMKKLAQKYQEDIELKFDDQMNLDFTEHLDERTELKDLLETITSLEHVIKELLPGRMKFIKKQLEEIRQKNNAEILKFFNE